MLCRLLCDNAVLIEGTWLKFSMFDNVPALFTIVLGPHTISRLSRKSILGSPKL